MTENLHEDVVLLDQIEWPFGKAEPVLRLPPSYEGGFSRTETVDAFPAYAHELDVVRATLGHVKACAPLDPSPIVYVLAYETPARTNGWAEPERKYGEDGSPPASGRIVLPGKRIPPHPAVTRYVVAHEYGHHVDFDLARRRGLEPGDGALHEEYAELRGCPERAGQPYGGGTWHATVGELVANDFRILITEVETEYWPHAGFPRPHEVDGLAQWWHHQLAPART